MVVVNLLDGKGGGATGSWVQIPASGLHLSGRCTAYINGTWGNDCLVTIQQSHDGSTVFPTVLVDGTTAATFTIATGDTSALLELEPHATHYRAITAASTSSGISVNLVF